MFSVKKMLLGAVAMAAVGVSTLHADDGVRNNRSVQRRQGTVVRTPRAANQARAYSYQPAARSYSYAPSVRTSRSYRSANESSVLLPRSFEGKHSPGR